MVIRVVPVFFSLIFIWVTFLLGKRLYSEKIGWYSAIYAALSPFMLTFRGLMTDSDYIMVNVAGSISLILFHAWQAHPFRGKLLGLICVLLIGFWLHPAMGYYLVAMCVVWLARKVRPAKHQRLGQMSRAIVGFLGKNSTLIEGTAGWYMIVIATLTLPIILGFIVPPPYHHFDITAQIALNGSIWGTFAVVLTVLIAFLVFRGGGRLIQQGESLLPVFAFLTLFIFSAFSIILRVKLDSLTLPRYLMPIYSAIPLGVWTLFDLTRKKVWLRPVFMAGLLSVNLYGNLSIKPISMPYNLLTWLENRDGNQFIYTDYWTGYWLAFESDEKIIPAIIDEQNHPGLNRYPPYAKQVEKSSNPLHVYTGGENNEIEFRKYLDDEGITYQLTQIGKYVIYSELSRRVTYPLVHQ
jgi:hypothetical protein